MKNVMKNLVVAVLLMAGMFVGDVRGDVAVTDPEQLMAKGASSGQYLMMVLTPPDNLTERIDGIDSVVDKGDGEYYIFFVKNVPGGIEFGGYIDTDNENSDVWPGYEGWCDGIIYRSIFSEGSSPDYVLAVYDDDGGQFAMLLTIGGIDFDENVVLWESGSPFFASSGGIEYNGVLDGIVGGLVFEGESILNFGHTVLVPSEPVSANEMPVADAGEDIIADANDTVILDASASYDLDGSIVSYTWTVLPEGTILYSGASPTCSTKALGLVEQVMILTVTDDRGASSEDVMSIFNRIVAEIASGSQGDQGPAGPQGPQGDQGPAGISPQEIAQMQAQITALQQSNALLQQQIDENKALPQLNRDLLALLPQLKMKVDKMEAAQSSAE